MAMWMHGKSTLRHCLIILVECDFLKKILRLIYIWQKNINSLTRLSAMVFLHVAFILSNDLHTLGEVALNTHYSNSHLTIFHNFPLKADIRLQLRSRTKYELDSSVVML